MNTLIILILAVIIGATDAKKTHEFKTESDRQSALFTFTIVMMGFGYATLVRSIVKVYNIPVSSMLVIFLLGVIHGCLGNYIDYVGSYNDVIYEISPYTYVSAIIPILVFKVSFCLDVHTFIRAWLQIILLSYLGVMISAVFYGLIAMAILNSQWNWTFLMAMNFGLIATPIYPDEIIQRLKEIEKSKHLIILLEGETVFASGTIFLVYKLLWLFQSNYYMQWWKVILIFFQMLIVGLAIGYVMGLFACYMFTVFYNDKLSMMYITIVAPLFTYYLSQDAIGDSGLTSVAVIGIMLGNERSSLTSEAESFLVTNWELLAYCADSTIYFLYGVVSFHIFLNHARIIDYALIVVMYILNIFGRFFMFFCLAPIISRIAYGLTFTDTVIVVWGGLRGSMTLGLTMCSYIQPVYENMKIDLVIHMVGLVVWSQFLNVSFMTIIMKFLGLFDLSMARKTNMNTCMRQVLNRRERTICMLKMDRFLAQANWPQVWDKTLFKHPYQLNLRDSDDEDDYYLGFTVCPECKIEVAAEPTTKQAAEMQKEARLRILKAKKISYTRQYETGMISKNGFRTLGQAVEVAMDSEEALIEVDGLLALFKRKGFTNCIKKRLQNLFIGKTKKRIKAPRKYWHRVCYYIVIHPAFDPFIYTVILLNVISVIVELCTKPESNSTLNYCLVIFNVFFFVIYVSEFLLKVFGYSYIHVCKDGMKTYFSSTWNIFDFSILVVAVFDLFLDIMDILPSNTFNKSSSFFGKITLVGRLFRVFRMIRLVRVCKSWYPNILKWMDSIIDRKIAYAYDIGKGFVTGEEEVLDMLAQMVENNEMREDMRMRMEADKLMVTKELGLVQRDRPWIAITVKTKQAIMTVLNNMCDSIYELKVAGWVDEIEYKKLMLALNNRFKYVRTIKKVQPSPPQVIFKEVPWMAHDDEIIDFLYANVKTKVFEAGEVICSVGEMSEGIYIIVTGLLKLTYLPQALVLENLVDQGELPIMDYLSTTRFDEKIKDFIVSGNSIGELHVLTGRPYNCKIVANTASQAYVLTHEVMKEAIMKSMDPTQGLAARLWKFVSMRLATAVLMQVPAYQSFKLEKIRYMLDRAFVPDLCQFRVFVVNDMMEDIVLIEGMAIDFNTSEVFTAPSYIPRTVQKIILVRNEAGFVGDLNIEPKLLIIPIQNADEYEIMELGEDQSEMLPVSSSRCLKHRVQKYKSARKKRKKGRMQQSLNKQHTLDRSSLYTRKRTFDNSKD